MWARLMIEFGKDVRGNVAMIFAICLLPVMMFMGASVDFSRQRSAALGAQNAVDAALLAVAHEALDLSEEELTAKGRKWFEGQNHQNQAYIIESFRITKTDNLLTATMIGSVETTLLGLAGIDSLKIVPTASVAFGVSDVEVMLVLDTTGSMADKVSDDKDCSLLTCTSNKTKLETLKDSATAMINTLENSTNGSDKVSVGIVPYATYVNVGSANKSASWIDSAGDSPQHSDNLAEGINRFDVYEHLGYEWKGCVQARPHPYDVLDTKPRMTKPETLFVPVFHPDEPDTVGNTQLHPNNFVADTESLGSISADLANPIKYGVPVSILDLWVPPGIAKKNIDDDDDCEEDDNNGWGNGGECGATGNPTNPATWSEVTLNANYQLYSNVSSPIGPQFGCDVRTVTPLTTKWSELRTEIKSLTASGMTAMSEGLAWGWRLLSPGAPFTEGKAYSDKTHKILVLLSDGNNSFQLREKWETGSDFSAYGYAMNERLDGIDDKSDQDDIDKRMDELTLEVCTNIKNEGIRIITVRLDLTDERSENILKSCASSEDDFIDVKNAGQLTKAFLAITDKVTEIHLSK